MDPTNGMVDDGAATFGMNAIYTCNEGYTLIGNMMRTCQANEMWSGSDPGCFSECHSACTVANNICETTGLCLWKFCLQVDNDYCIPSSLRLCSVTCYVLASIIYGISS